MTAESLRTLDEQLAVAMFGIAKDSWVCPTNWRPAAVGGLTFPHESCGPYSHRHGFGCPKDGDDKPHLSPYSSNPQYCALVKRKLREAGIPFVIWISPNGHGHPADAQVFIMGCMGYTHPEKAGSCSGNGPTEEEAVARFALARHAAGLLDRKVAP